MYTQQQFQQPAGIPELIARLSQFDGGCDPDFDFPFEHEELERQFAEYRQTLAHD
jgi:hypothetical protein